MMGIVLLAIWTIGALIYLADPKNKASQWVSAVAIVGGFGFLAGTLDEEIRPYLETFSFYHPLMGDVLKHAVQIASFICQAGLPYTFLMFAIYSSTLIPNRWRKWIGWLGFIPLAFTFYMTPLIPKLSLNYQIMVFWVVPYILLSSSLLILQYFQERDPIVRRGRLLILILVVLPLVFVMCTIYIARIWGYQEAWKYNIVLIFLQFIFFLAFSIKYGVMGVKVRVEQDRMSSTLRALTSGASILNHTIKNEIGKIQLMTHRLEAYAKQMDHQGMLEDLQYLQHSSEHILDMVQRIQGKMKDVECKEEAMSLSTIIEESIRSILPYSESYGIHVQNEMNEKIMFRGDPIHLQEVLINLLTNAVEAMKKPGKIKIHSYTTKRYVVISVEDEGKGIPKENIPLIFEPFYSTKKNQATNFGLGLAYCFQVMRKHQGLMEVKSAVGQGTTFFLYFPLKRVIYFEERSK